MTSTHKKIIQITIAIFLVTILIFTVNWQEVFAYIRYTDKYLLALFVLFYVGGILISARKWQILGRFLSFANPYFFYIKTYVLGTFINNFFPSFVGGDTYRTIALGKNQKRIGDSSATVVVDRMTGFLAIIFLAFFCGIANREMLQENILVGIFILCLGGTFCFFVAGVSLFRTQAVQKMIINLPQSIQRYITVLVQFRVRSIALRSFLYSLLFSFVGIAIANYFLFISIGVQISLIEYMSVIFLTNLIASLPLSVGNIGTKEWAYIFLFGIFGIEESALVAIVLLSRVLQMLISLVALPLYMNKKDILHKTDF